MLSQLHNVQKFKVLSSKCLVILHKDLPPNLGIPNELFPFSDNLFRNLESIWLGNCHLASFLGSSSQMSVGLQSGWGWTYKMARLCGWLSTEARRVLVPKTVHLTSLARCLRTAGLLPWWPASPAQSQVGTTWSPGYSHESHSFTSATCIGGSDYKLDKTPGEGTWVLPS
jgi:hypothetical protein